MSGLARAYGFVCVASARASRKGDAAYWTGNGWQAPEECVLWGADLTRRMLEEGLVPTNVEAARTVMYAASNPEHEPWRGGPHVLVDDAVAVYTQLKPAQTEPWVPQPTTGYATNHDGDDVFVGEHGDLLWRVLTETDHTGWSPLKARLYKTVPPAQQQTEMVAAAALNIENSLTCQHRRYPS